MTAPENYEAWIEANRQRLAIIVDEIARQAVEGCPDLVSEGDVAAAIKGARRALALLVADPRAFIEVEEVWI